MLLVTRWRRSSLALLGVAVASLIRRASSINRASPRAASEMSAPSRVMTPAMRTGSGPQPGGNPHCRTVNDESAGVACCDGLGTFLVPVPGAPPAFRCLPMPPPPPSPCVTNDNSCDASGDCCGDLVCYVGNNKCGHCIDNGNHCPSTQECCGQNICYSGDSKCGPCVQSGGQDCATDEDCCAGNVCDTSGPTSVCSPR